MNNHPFSIRAVGVLGPVPAILRQRPGTPWTSHQGRRRERDNPHSETIQLPVDLKRMSLDCGSRSTWREPTQEQGEYADSAQKGLGLESNPRPSYCEVTMPTTASPCKIFFERIQGQKNKLTLICNNFICFVIF